MNYIIVGIHGRPSMKGVYSQMRSNSELIVRRVLKSGKIFYRRYTGHNVDNLQKLSNFNPSNGDTIIRWGTRMEFSQKGFKSLNSMKGLARATNKRLTREILMEAGVPCPRLITPENFDRINPSKVIARPENHSKGKNFVVLNNRGQFLDHYRAGWYYSEFINKTSEYRVHCFYGKALCVLKKPKPTDGETIAWNRSINHEAFEHVPHDELKRSVILVALNACKALGLTMGAVDVIWKNPNAYVLEVNTAPTLNSSPHTTEKYARAFDWAFNFGNKEWEYEKFEKASSLMWKNFQFEAPIP